ncbi:hypothetical protein [Rhabdobacter roseus]
MKGIAGCNDKNKRQIVVLLRNVTYFRKVLATNMNKQQLIFNLRMEIAALRQALRDSDDVGLTEEQINTILDRMNYLLALVRKLEE